MAGLKRTIINNGKTIFIVLLLEFLAFFLFYGGMLSQWLALILALYGFIYLWKLGREIIPPFWKNKLSNLTPPLLLVGFSTSLYYKFLLGKMPWMADHSVHLTKSYILYNKFFSDFSLTGWTNFSGSGYPAEVLYPPLTDIYLCLVKFLSFGLLDWEQSYAVAFFVFLLFYPLVFYFVGKKHFGKAGGFFAALAALTDLGGFRQGGWIFAVKWGVWPISLSLGLLVLASHYLFCWLAHKTDYKKAVIFSTLAILAHPLALIILVPILLIMVWVLFAREGGLWSQLKRMASYLVPTALLCGWWLFPFMVFGTEYSMHVSALSGTINNAVAGLVNFNIWNNAWPPIAALALLGAVLVFFNAASSYLFSLATLAAGALILTTSTYLAGLDLFNLIPSFKHVQFPRFLMLIKACSFLLAGYFISRFIMFAKEINQPPLKHKWALRFVVIVIIAAILPTFAKYFVEKKVLPLKNYQTTPGYRRGLKEIAQFIRTETESTEYFKVALAGKFGEHRHTVFAIYSGLPFFKLTYIPADTYKYRAHKTRSRVPDSPEELKLLNVKWIVSLQPVTIKKTKLVRKIEGVYLYRFKNYSSQRVRAAQGKTELLEFSDEKLKIKLSDVKGKNTEVYLPLSPFPNWKALNNGKEVKLEVWRPSTSLTLQKLKAEPGIIELSYHKSFLESCSGYISLLVLLLLLLPVKIWRKLAEILKLERWNQHIGVIFYWVKNWILYLLRDAVKKKWIIYPLGFILFILVLATIHYLRFVDSNQEDLMLAQAEVKVIQNNRIRKCYWFFPQRWVCGKGLSYVGTEARMIGEEIESGNFLHPQKHKKYVVSYPEVKFKERLLLNYGLDNSNPVGAASVLLKLKIDGKQVKKVVIKRRSIWQELILNTAKYKDRNLPLTIEISMQNKGTANLLFDIKLD
ncbi:MAG: hypothetical protein ACQES9_08890 [Myxococcota bacterium]